MLRMGGTVVVLSSSDIEISVLSMNLNMNQGN